MRGKAFFLWLLLLVATLLIGCGKDQSTNFQTDKHNELGEVSSALKLNDIDKNIPISIEEGEFERIYGWLDGETIVYSTNLSQRSNVYAYNFKKDTNRLLLKSEALITSIDLSDSGNFLLVRASPMTNENIITVIKKDGTVVFSDKIDAFDVAIQWNPYDEQRILISTFAEDWQDQTFEISLADHTMTEMELDNPFSYWSDEDQLLYLAWKQEEDSLFADLVKKDIISDKEKVMKPNIYQIDTFKNTIMTIAVNEDKKDQAVYHFYQSDFKSIGSFQIPQLMRFSDWLVPFYDFNEEHNMFLTFMPQYSGNVNTYNEGFQLIEYDLRTKEKKVIMDGLENEPLSCSPNGNLCLYGYNFEKLIDLENNKIIDLTT